MFFLGLLSTPMPYLLLAAFYFFGFAMGMFNNKTGEEITEPLASVTIPADIKENAPDHAVYYYQVSQQTPIQVLAEYKSETQSIGFIPDTSPTSYLDYYLAKYEFKLSNSLFCRPPPTVC